MSDATERKVDWAFQGAIAGLVALLVLIGGYYCSTNNSLLQKVSDKQHELELRLSKREGDAFTAQHGIEVWKAIRHNTESISDTKLSQENVIDSVRQMLARIEQKMDRQPK